MKKHNPGEQLLKQFWFASMKLVFQKIWRKFSSNALGLHSRRLHDNLDDSDSDSDSFALLDNDSDIASHFDDDSDVLTDSQS